MLPLNRQLGLSMRRLLPNLHPTQARPMRACHLASAGRRDGPTQRTRQRPDSQGAQYARRPSKQTSGPRSQPQAEPEPEDVDVPSVGWMWQPTSGAGGSKAAAAAGARPMPSASATVANLYGDRIKAKKSLGQNFLTDDSVLQDLVVAAGVGPGDLVLEVGPGTGNLTKHLLARGARVTAVEKDDTLYGRLVEEYREVPELRLVHGDALKVGMEEVILGMLNQDRPAPDTSETAGSASGPENASQPGSEASTSSSDEAAPSKRSLTGGKGAGGRSGPRSTAPRKVKVVANLPYNITRDLLTLLLPMGDVISDLHIMIQHEAALRLTEREPGGPEWRAANIRTLFYSKPKYRFRISRHKYDPVPGVDGALVTFALLPPASRPRVPSERAFHALVAKAFSERRKKMRNSVQPLYTPEQVESALTASGLNADARAQDLTLEQFVEVASRLHKQQLAEGLALLETQGSAAASDAAALGLSGEAA